MINKNMLNLGKNRSAIRELFEQGKILKEKYGDDNVYDFSLGNPSVPCPDFLNTAIKNLITISESLKNTDGNFDDIDIILENYNTNYDYRKLSSTMLHGYTSAPGDKIVRDAISSYLNKTYNVNTSSDLIYLTTGAAAALSITLKALSSPDGNSEVIVFAPFFPEYSVFIKNANAKVTIVKPNYKTFYPDFNDFESKINENTSLVIINSPNNPTGVYYNEDVLKNICQILEKKQREFSHPIYLISDEPYRELLYTYLKYNFITNFYKNSIITYSFSKSLSIPGERIGYILVNPECDNANDVFYAVCGAGRSLGYVCATSLFQFLIPHCLGLTSDTTTYKRNAETLYRELTQIGYEVVKPDGAFYLFVKCPINDDNAFSKKALEYNLLLVPSESFGVTGYFRIATCVTEKQVTNSIPKFNELFNFYKNR
ncbi:MAG: pyridoxal phosphate-dependent aminotransferase [Lachnospiraceae bacterium]|nr:pyridoxal phosphate-dependent aminotransferase [Lachnospiraceae bacterium]